MPNYRTQIALFLSSYAPLWLIFAIQNARTCRWLSAALILMTGVTVFVLYLHLRAATTLGRDIVRVERASSRSNEVMGYVAAYLLPFLRLRLDRGTDVLSLLVFLFVIGIVYAKSNLIHVNPVLTIMGYHIFEIECKQNATFSLITRRRVLIPGEDIVVVRLGDYVLFERVEEGINQ